MYCSLLFYFHMVLRQNIWCFFGRLEAIRAITEKPIACKSYICLGSSLPNEGDNPNLLGFQSFQFSSSMNESKPAKRKQ